MHEELAIKAVKAEIPGLANRLRQKKRTRSTFLGIIFALGGSGGLINYASAQTPRVVHLGTVLARSADGFTRVSSVRELSDGRVIMVDENERTVQVLDRNLQEAKQIGRWGSGPGEYTMPRQLVKLGGDTTGVFDRAGGRILRIMPDARPGDIIRGFAPAGDASGSFVSATAADQRGHLYALTLPEVRSEDGKSRLMERTAIIRWRPDGKTRDTVSLIEMPARAGARAGATIMGRRAALQVPFEGRPAWAVADDGMVAVVSHSPYSMEIVRPDGSRRRSGPINYEPLRVTEAHKDEWRRERREPAPILVTRLDRRESSIRTGTFPFTEPKEWPRFLPPFLPGAARFSPDGTLWVQRTTTAGARPIFDLFNANAALTRRVGLPTGCRLVGFGKGSVYVVRADDFNLEYLERIAIQP